MVDLKKQYKKLVRIVDELNKEYEERKFSIDGHLLGSIGELLVAEEYDLQLKDTNTPYFDAIVKRGKHKGKSVQIKTTRGQVVNLPNADKYDVLLAVSIDGEGNLEEIYFGPSSVVRDKMKSLKNKRLSVNQLKNLNLIS